MSAAIRRLFSCGRDQGQRFAMRVTTAEASGPSGAGSRAGADRNPRQDSGLRIVRPASLNKANDLTWEQP